MVYQVFQRDTDFAIKLVLVCKCFGMSSSRVEANMVFAPGKPGTCTKAFTTVTGICAEACEHFFRPPNRSSQEKVAASRSDYHHQNREFIVDSGAHMMSESALAAGQRETIRTSKAFTAVVTARCDSVRERFGRFCSDDAVGRVTSSATSGLFVRGNGLLL